MTPVQITKFKCDKCGTLYGTREAAIKCESRPVTYDDVQIGEAVLITGGEGTGLELKVEEKFVLSMEWGHYAWERYWHTVAVTGPIAGSFGHRQLTFDQRAKVKKEAA